MKKTVVTKVLQAISGTNMSMRAQPTALDLRNRGFFHGREYFAVRSGRLQCFIQADRADLGPAITGYLFDANNILQQNDKVQAFNYRQDNGVRNSALEVISYKSKFAFTAFGEQTRAHWITSDGIATVEATWWADGVRVDERFSGLAENGTIRRSISLTGANLHGDEKFILRLRLPTGNSTTTNRVLLVTHQNCPQALVVTGNEPLKMDMLSGVVEIGPITVLPDKTVTIETFMLAQIPANTADDFQKQIARVTNDAGSLIQATKKRWDKVSLVETDDTIVRELFDICRWTIPAMVSDDGFLRGGPFQYPFEWIRDGSLTTLGLTAAGDFELARAVLEHQIRDLTTAEGKTIVNSSYQDPDREQIDQSGQLLLALRWYTEFSGDATLVAAYRDKLISIVERPLKPEFRDATGLIHNRREFWEQTMDDAYELSYNTYAVVALREAAALAVPLGAQDRKQQWLNEADAVQQAMMKTFVQDGALIKRRNVTGEVAKHLVQTNAPPDVPSSSAEHHLIYPDATMALPIALGLVEPGSALATNTLNEIEKLRNQRWWGGGYGRYDASAEINMPGEWAIAGVQILRGQHVGGMLDRSRSTLEWFRNVQGGNSGLYYEEIPLIAGSQQSWLGVVTWPTGEIPFFIVRDYLGVSFENGAVVIKPQLYQNSPPIKADLRFRKGRLHIEVDGSGSATGALLDGKPVNVSADGAIRLPDGFAGGTLVIRTAKRLNGEAIKSGRWV